MIPGLEPELMATYSWSVAVHAVDMVECRALCGMWPRAEGKRDEMRAIMARYGSPRGWGWDEFTEQAVTCAKCRAVLNGEAPSNARRDPAKAGRWPDVWRCRFTGCTAEQPATTELGNAKPLPPGWGRRRNGRVLCPEHWTESVRYPLACAADGCEATAWRLHMAPLPPGWAQGRSKELRGPNGERLNGRGYRYFCPEHADQATLPPARPALTWKQRRALDRGRRKAWKSKARLAAATATLTRWANSEANRGENHYNARRAAARRDRATGADQ